MTDYEIEFESDDDEEKVKAVYSAVHGFSNALLVKMNADPLEVAAVLASNALSIYKTTLPPKDFEAIVDAISASRDSVRAYEPMHSSETVH